MPEAHMWRVEVTAEAWQERAAAEATVRGVGVEAVEVTRSSTSITFDAGPINGPTLDRCLSATGLRWTMTPTPPDDLNMLRYYVGRVVEALSPGLQAGIARPNSERQERLRNALADAYRDYDQIELMLRDRLDVSLAGIWPPAPLGTVWSKVLDEADRRGWQDRLICAARRGNPGNLRLLGLMTDEFAHCATCRSTRVDACPALDAA